MTTWDEAFAEDYDEWSAHMTEDVAFYVDLAPARRTDPWWNWPSATVGWRSRSRGRPAGR